MKLRTKAIGMAVVFVAVIAVMIAMQIETNTILMVGLFVGIIAVMSLMSLSTKDISIAALFVSIIAIMTFTPLGMIPLPTVKLAVVLMPLLICAMTTKFQVGLMVSIIFGILSMVNNYINATSILSFAFQNPLISVLPRSLIGPIVYLTYHGMQKVLNVNTAHLYASKLDEDNIQVSKSRKKNILSATVATAVGVTANTLMFFIMLLLVYGGEVHDGTQIGFALIGGIAVSNYIPEVIASSIICPLIITGVQRAVK